MKDKYWIRAMAVIMAVIMFGSPLSMQMSTEAAKKMNKTSLSMNVGKRYTLKIPGVKKVKWRSSNKSVASVNSKGKVTAKKKGSATISAKAGGKTYKCQVIVKQPVRSVTLNKSSITLTKNQSYTLKAAVIPKNANNKKIAWASSDRNVATVSSKGVVKAVRKGRCVITAEAADGKSAFCTVYVDAKDNYGEYDDDDGYNDGSDQEAKPTCPHKWDSGKVTKEPTCKDAGEKIFTCRLCGKTKKMSISPTGEHLWKHTVTEATCTSFRVEEDVCTVCGAIRNRNTFLQYGDHSWVPNGTVESTCGTDGKVSYQCSVCGATKEEVIPATGIHSWDAGVVTREPGCGSEGEKFFTCSVCGTTKTEPIPATGTHTWVDCAEEGHYEDYTVYIGSCQVCNQCGKVFVPRRLLNDYLVEQGVTEEEIVAAGYNIVENATIAVGDHTFLDGLGCYTWSNKRVPIVKTKWVVDKPARKECSVCGAVQ